MPPHARYVMRGRRYSMLNFSFKCSYILWFSYFVHLHQGQVVFEVLYKSKKKHINCWDMPQAETLRP